MPHVIVKLWPGKSDEQKHRLSEAIVRDVTRIFEYGEESVSVGFEEVSPSQWTARVYEPDIRSKWNTLTKQPRYEAEPNKQRRALQQQRKSKG